MTKRLMRGGAIYVLPNLLTTGNLFFGYFSIVKSMQGQFEWGGVAILLAAIFDVLDGRVARLTNSSSEFGVQYDSLCDLVSFGLAPAFLMYQYQLQGLGKLGWILCFIFLACGALRLARFNVQSSIGKASGDFTGLPIPMAAAVIACFVALTADLNLVPGTDEEISGLFYLQALMGDYDLRRILLTIFAPGLAALMVSNVAYRSHKSMKFKWVKPFRLLVVLVGVIGLTAYNPPFVGFVFFFLYALSGPFEWILGWKKPSDDDEFFEPLEDDASVMEPQDPSNS